MKQLFTTSCLVMALLLLQSQAEAQPTHGITFRENFYNYVTPQPDKADWKDIFSNSEGKGIELAYNRRLARHTWLLVPVKFGKATILDDNDNRRINNVLGNLDLMIQENLFKHGNFITPTLGLGVGSTYNFTTGDFDFNIPAALGFNIRLVENVYVNAQTQYRFSTNNNPGWHHGVGVVVYFGNEDRDEDGIVDKEDKCPDVAGVAALMGCPDRDSDGITDADDKCPDLAGTLAMMGCPDKDSDGITDADDACPEVAGIVAFKGCPDTDSDGITDADDKCPTEAGPVANMGCPIRDRDSDGVVDAEDACPDQKGPASTRGCPDRDSDGVADKDDACPDKKGDSMHKGCPDTDGDGIYDMDDRCVDVAGPASNRGCPEIKKEDRARVELAVKAVQFESGKAILLTKSYKVLDDVAAVLKSYPYYSLDLRGHTDSQGDEKMNHDLSHARAKACYDYLISKGIAASRLTSEGFGETKPIADNMYAPGRALNRRVEFDLIVK